MGGEFGFNAQSARVVMSGRRFEGVWVTSEAGVRKTDRAACEGQKTDNYQLPVRGDRQSLSWLPVRDKRQTTRYL